MSTVPGFDAQTLDVAVKLGNSFASEIIVYLEKYINDALRNEIKLQYRKDLTPPTNQSLLLETEDIFSLNIKNKYFIDMLSDVLKEVSNDSDARKELEIIKEGIELS